MTAGTSLDIVKGVTTVENVEARSSRGGSGVYGGMLTGGIPKASNGQAQEHEHALGSVAKDGSPAILSGLPSRSTSGATGSGAGELSEFSLSRLSGGTGSAG